MPLASVIDWLDQHQGASTAILTATLVAVTVYYAVQNAKMAREMRRARGAAILPKLALDFHRLGPSIITPEIKNVGPGTALDIDVTLTWEPAEDHSAPPPMRWRWNVLAPGESVDFLGPNDSVGESLKNIPDQFIAMRLTGAMKDAAGTKHEVKEEFRDLHEWREVLYAAHQRWVHSDPERRLADALHSKFKDPLKKLTRATENVAGSVSRLRQPDDD